MWLVLPAAARYSLFLSNIYNIIIIQPPKMITIQYTYNLIQIMVEIINWEVDDLHPQTVTLHPRVQYSFIHSKWGLLTKFEIAKQPANLL